MVTGSMVDAAHKVVGAPIIAFIGCDGSGKSTLSVEVADILNKTRQTSLVYLGLGSGDIGRRIQQLPFVGPTIERVLSRKAKKTRTPGENIPGVLTALVVFLFSCKRFFAFKKLLKAHQNNIQIVTDRYPQAELAGCCDGPGLSAGRTQNPIIAWLVCIEKRLYQKMASVHPTVIIFLDVDLQTAAARKPDHNVDLLATKIEKTRMLRFDGAPIEKIDARQSYAAVKEQALAIIEKYTA